MLGDATWLNELFSNLVHNAIQYTPDRGHVTVRAAPHGEGVEISVSDDGPGIPAESLTRIFERGPVGADRAGAGLGLTIAREITLAHGGQIYVASDAGRGSAFSVWLPTGAG